MNKHRNKQEKQLAIEMWEHIREHLNDPDFSLYREKRDFCAEHNLNWLNDCWLCTIFSDCIVCPLRSCGKDDLGGYSSYMRACILREKDACNEIIEVIRGVTI